MDKALGYLGENIDVVLCDVSLGGEAGGLDLLKLWKKQRAAGQFILLTGQSRVSDAVAAIKAGAAEYLAKPVSQEQLAEMLERAILAASGKPAEKAQTPGQGDFNLGLIVGQSAAMKQVLARIERVAQSDSTVLILSLIHI